MFGVNWRTSPRQYDVRVEQHVRITMDDGVEIDAQVYRPDTDGAFPALLGVHAYDAAMQATPSSPGWSAL